MLRGEDAANVQVRNVADALYLSIDQKSNGRFALFNDIFDYQSLANRSRELFPDLAKADKIPVGKPEETPSSKGTFKLDGSKAEKELGLKCELRILPWMSELTYRHFKRANAQGDNGTVRRYRRCQGLKSEGEVYVFTR